VTIPRPRSLRGRLICGITILAAAVVLGAQAAGVLVLHTWLLHRVDEQLTGFPVPTATMPAPPSDASVTLPSDFRVVIYDAAGRRGQGIGQSAVPGPSLPPAAAGLPSAARTPATVAAASGDGSWRISVRTTATGETFVVCLPLDTVDGATTKLVWFNAALLLVAVAAVIGLGWPLVGIGLRPLTRMRRTASDITAHEPRRRIADDNPHTEIGRLGIVLNTMLDRLEIALRQARASEERLRRFIADAGHELRTPLTTIQGFAQLALRSPEDGNGERQEADRVIARDAQRMSRLIDDLLLLAQLDLQPAFRRDPVDLLEIAADVIGSAAPHGGSRLRLTALDGGDVLAAVPVPGDADRLHQVVANLLTNALRHTAPNTQVQVRVGTAVVTRENGGADTPRRFSPLPQLTAGTAVGIVEVADQGPGLAPEEAARVFERFYRVDPARSRDRGGSGLGLAISAAIAQGHGGRLEVDTSPGQGAVFRLVLPTPR
jgi:two-component system OmpR family sensor kinase